MFLTNSITSPGRKLGEERKTAKIDTKSLYLWICKKIYNQERNRKGKGHGSKRPRIQKGLTRFRILMLFQ